MLKKGQTALSAEAAERGTSGLQMGTEWSVPFFSIQLDSSNRVKDRQDHHRSRHGDQNTVKVQPGDSRKTEESGQPASHDRSDHTQKNVEKQPLASPVHDLAADESGHQSQYDPREDGHPQCPSLTGQAVSILRFS